MRPIIGITSRHSRENHRYNLPDAYAKAVQRNGGTPIILPPLPDIDHMQLLDAVDGLILSGGADVDPMLYGEQPVPQQRSISPLRDSFEHALVLKALEAGKPILAICRGAQILNVATGGTLVQDTNTQVKNPVKHRQEAPASYGTHHVHLEPGTLIHRILGKDTVTSNSLHHQSVKTPGEGMKITGKATDGVIESMEKPGEHFVLAVQWHPEHMDNPDMNKLFKALVDAST